LGAGVARGLIQASRGAGSGAGPGHPAVWRSTPGAFWRRINSEMWRGVPLRSRTSYQRIRRCSGPHVRAVDFRAADLTVRLAALDATTSPKKPRRRGSRPKPRGRSTTSNKQRGDFGAEDDAGKIAAPGRYPNSRGRRARRVLRRGDPQTGTYLPEWRTTTVRTDHRPDRPRRAAMAPVAAPAVDLRGARGKAGSRRDSRIHSGPARARSRRRLLPGGRGRSRSPTSPSGARGVMSVKGNWRPGKRWWVKFLTAMLDRVRDDSGF